MAPGRPPLVPATQGCRPRAALAPTAARVRGGGRRGVVEGVDCSAPHQLGAALVASRERPSREGACAVRRELACAALAAPQMEAWRLRNAHESEQHIGSGLMLRVVASNLFMWPRGITALCHSAFVM